MVLLIPYYINSSTISLKDLFLFFNSYFWTTCSIFYNEGLKNSDAIKVMPFDYSRIVFSSFIGFSFFSERITENMIFGALIIVFAGIRLMKTKSYNLRL